MEKQEFYKNARADSRGPLEGIKVLEATNFGAGPICGMVLVDLGATSIKCEMPGTGDPVRQMYPYLQDDRVEGSVWYQTFNRGKQAITLDFRKPEGRDLFKRLALEADIVVENFTPGTMAKWGLGYDDIAAIKPDIVYISISGFGQFGPLSTKKGFDPIAQAMAGMMHSTGEKNGPPLRAGPAIADNMVGWHGAMGAMAALLHRNRTGEGQHVEAGLTDVILYTTDVGIMGEANCNYHQVRNGSTIDSGAPFNTFLSKDGHYIFINAAYNAHWVRLCELMNRADLITDPRTSEYSARGDNRDFVNEVVTAWAASQSLDEAMRQLDEKEVTAGPVLDFRQILDLPHYRERDAIVEIEHPKFGRLSHYGVPTKYSRTPAQPKGYSPMKGEHNDLIYRDHLHLSEAQVAELKQKKVI